MSRAAAGVKYRGTLVKSCRRLGISLFPCAFSLDNDKAARPRSEAEPPRPDAQRRYVQ